MILFSDNIISVSSDLEGVDTFTLDTSTPEDSEGIVNSTSEDPEGIGNSTSEDLEVVDTTTPEDLDSKDTSVSSQQSAPGETQQTVVPNIVNDIVVPDNSYSKYCFFFLMLLFALFVGRSFRKGV